MPIQYPRLLAAISALAFISLGLLGPTQIEPSQIKPGASGTVLTCNGSTAAWSAANTVPTAGTAGRLLYDNGSAAAYAAAGSSAQTLRFNGTTPTPTSVLTNDGAGIGINMGSTSEAGLTINGIASQTSDYLDILDSSSNAVFNVGYSTGITGRLSGGDVFAAQNLSTPSGGGTNLGRFMGGALASAGSFVNGGTLSFISDGAWSSSAAPTRAVITLATTSSLSRASVWAAYSNRDIVNNANLAALSTSATAGFVFVPNMAGSPSGSPSSYTGNSATVFDTTNDVLWVNDGTRWTASFTSYAAAYASGGTLGSETVANVTSGSSALTIAPQSSPPDGKLVTIIKADNGSGTVTVGSLRGITAGAYTISTQYHSCTIRATGGNWYYLYGD